MKETIWGKGSHSSDLYARRLVRKRKYFSLSARQLFLYPRMMSASDCSWELLSFEKIFIMVYISQSYIHLLFLIVYEHYGDRHSVFSPVFTLIVGIQYTVFDLHTIGVTVNLNFAPLNISAFEIRS